MNSNNPVDHLKALVNEAIEKLPYSSYDCLVTFERPKSSKHGDYSCNLALQLSKKLKKNPRVIATDILEVMPSSDLLERVEVAGAGFLNFYLDTYFKQKVISDILKKGLCFGDSSIGSGKKILIEFVSANPTGPLHIGHGRGAVFGSTLARVMEKCSFSVFREYYVNDAGRQIDILTLSVWYRYLNLFTGTQSFPENGYKGQYIEDLAINLKEKYGDRWNQNSENDILETGLEDQELLLDKLIENAKSVLGKNYETLKDLSVNAQIESCEKDLLIFGVNFDNWFSEKKVFSDGSVESVIEDLESKNLVDNRNGAKWFKSSEFSDDKDRVLKRSNGEYTYFASDVAYHHDKFQRGFNQIINIWGADHHGYVPRVKAALKALGHDSSLLKIVLIQFASLFRGEQKVSMSTRSGEFVTIKELVADVGVDAARYFYAMRKNDQHLDFDLDLAKKKSSENPVYYVQYAHARCASIISKWGGKVGDLSGHELQVSLDQPDEISLLRKLSDYPEMLENCCRDFVPHNITVYLRELAALLHRYYNATQILSADVPIRTSRLSLIAAVRQVLNNGLTLLGVSAPDSM